MYSSVTPGAFTEFYNRHHVVLERFHPPARDPRPSALTAHPTPPASAAPALLLSPGVHLFRCSAGLRSYRIILVAAILYFSSRFSRLIPAVASWCLAPPHDGIRPPCVDGPRCVYPAVVGRHRTVSGSHILAVVNKVAGNFVNTFLCGHVFISLGYIPYILSYNPK